MRTCTPALKALTTERRCLISTTEDAVSSSCFLGQRKYDCSRSFQISIQISSHPKSDITRVVTMLLHTLCFVSSVAATVVEYHEDFTDISSSDGLE